MDYKIVEYFLSDDQAYWLEQIQKSEWRCGEILHYLITSGELTKAFGETTQLFLLTDGDKLVGYCTFSPRDNIQPTTLTPWLGFLFIAPEYRGKKYSKYLIDYVESKAKEAGHKILNVSSNSEGFFEKFDYSFYRMMVDVDCYDLRVYQKALA